jgi:hypothetical protein
MLGVIIAVGSLINNMIIATPHSHNGIFTKELTKEVSIHVGKSSKCIM